MEKKFRLFYMIFFHAFMHSVPHCELKWQTMEVGEWNITVDVHSCCNLPVVVRQLDIVSRHKDLAILQPDEVRLGNTLSHTSEHGTAPCWFGHRLRPLKKLRRSWGGAEGWKWAQKTSCCLFSLHNNTGLCFIDSHTPTYKYLLNKRLYKIFL